ncbi:putative lipopolysaccharide heptosyltransferase III [Propionivibrio dicarboxylicus]|uniref:Heptosyltransferase-3 n=1 Tax=Propionivibrio dicarboxylicus TaxID=83767 RepID=A0A1G8L1A0_9RHOO|nr:putative lipopolysaccharide heptosyltransferase III [Propionivibrio dicarboxylicus]SDI49401.1 heptosyltransferase-3 [Propionivibrio dicarboxylicus]
MLKDTIPLDRLRRVLVVKLRHHGDVLLSSPVFSVLKAHAPLADIDALVYADTADMLSQHPAIDQLHVIDPRWKKLGPWGHISAELQLLRALRARRYDLVIHLTNHPRGAWIARCCSARWSVAPRTGGRGRWWQNAFSHFYPTPRHALRHTVELNLDALRRLGIQPTPDSRRLSLVPGPAAETRVDALLQEIGISRQAFIHLHPASRWFFKCWTVDNMAALVDRLHAAGHAVVLSAAPDAEERRMIEAIQAKVATPAFSFAGQLSLKELAALAARARLFIGVDSAPMHIAAAMGTPVVALFGPSGDKEWGPWGVPHRVVASTSHPCRPCGLDGCAGSKVSDCLVTLPLTQVWQAVEELLSA